VSLAPSAFVARLPLRLRRALSLLFALGTTHAVLSLQLIPVVGLMAFVHAVFPPMGAWVAIELATRAPLFALMVYGSGTMLMWALWAASQPTRTQLPRPLRWMLVASLSLWAVVGCGEGVRAALMETQLMGDARACHETRSLTASLRQRYAFEFDGGRRPHAWRVRGGEVALWSYRTLRFEPAPAWSGADTARAQCRSGQRAGAHR
jgi:hypothetical protein